MWPVWRCLSPTTGWPRWLKSHVPFIPAYFLLVDRYDPVDWLREYRGPVVVIVAGSDEIIPSTLGRHLYDEYAGPKMLQVIPGAHHADTTDEPTEWWKDVLDFWQHHPVGPSKQTAGLTPG